MKGLKKKLRDYLSARNRRKLLGAIDEIENLSADQPYSVERSSGGTNLPASPTRHIWALVTGSSSPYSFLQKVGVKGGLGTWRTPNSPIHGTNAYNLRAGEVFGGGKIVRLHYEESGAFWYFVWNGQGSCTTTFTIELVTPCDEAVANIEVTLEFPEGDPVSGTTDAEGHFVVTDERLNGLFHLTIHDPITGCTFEEDNDGLEHCESRLNRFYVCKSTITINVVSAGYGGTAHAINEDFPGDPGISFSLASSNTPQFVFSELGSPVKTGPTTWETSACVIDRYFGSNPAGGWGGVSLTDNRVYPDPDRIVAYTIDDDSDIDSCGQFEWCCDDHTFTVYLWGTGDGIYLHTSELGGGGAPFTAGNCSKGCDERTDPADIEGLGYIKRELFAKLHDTSPSTFPGYGACSMWGTHDNLAITLTFNPATEKWESGCIAGDWGDYFCVYCDSKGNTVPVGGPPPTDPAGGTVFGGGTIFSPAPVYSRHTYGSAKLEYDPVAYTLTVYRYFDSGCTNASISTCAPPLGLGNGWCYYGTCCFGDGGGTLGIAYTFSLAGDVCTPTLLTGTHDCGSSPAQLQGTVYE